MKLLTPLVALALGVAGAAAAAVATPSASAGNASALLAPSQHRLAYHGPFGMTVSWATHAQLPEPMVRYGLSPDALTRQARSRTSITYPTSTTWANHVVLEGLLPGTKYYYRVSHEDKAEPLSFTTARLPGDPRPYTTAVVVDMGLFGDLGASDHVPAGVVGLAPGETTTIERLVQDKDKYDLMLHPGDIAYADYWLKEIKGGYLNGTIAAGPQLYEELLEAFYDQLDPITSIRPYHVAPGNHDSNCVNFSYKTFFYESDCPVGQTNFTGYNKHWAMPGDVSGGQGNMWHSFDNGMVHYVMLNSETDLGAGIVAPDAPGGVSNGTDGPFGATMNSQIDWLKRDLAKVDRKLTPWIVASLHRPWYAASAKSSLCNTCQAAFEGILNEHGVDIVMSGHAHFMNRNGPLLPNGVVDPAGLENPKGPLYIVSGAAGHYDGLDKMALPLPTYARYANDTLYSYSRLTFHNRTHLTHDFVSSATGAILDTATLVKQH